MPYIIGTIIYLTIGAVTHWLFIGNAIDINTVGSFITIFGWPILYALLFGLIAFFVIVIIAAYEKITGR